jgi:hypothetical protein
VSRVALHGLLPRLGVFGSRVDHDLGLTYCASLFRFARWLHPHPRVVDTWDSRVYRSGSQSLHFRRLIESHPYAAGVVCMDDA